MAGLGFDAWLGRAYAWPASDHFDGQRFHNLRPTKDRDFGQLFRWWRERDPEPWQWVDNQPWPAPPKRLAAATDLRATFVNHATVLLQVGGVNILTDPTWSRRASPFRWAGPSRVRDPGVAFEDLPPIDLVVVSHSHYDHLDTATLVRLNAAHRPLFVVGLGNGRLLRRLKIDRLVELDWWGRVEIAPGTTLTSVPVQHWSGRGLTDRNKTLWSGYVVEAPGGPIYFAGDTGYADHFRAARERFGAFRLALLPIGAFLPRWFMEVMHLSPDDAIKAHRDLEAQTSLAIHFGTFHLGDDGQHEAPDRLAEARTEAGLTGTQIWVPEFGEGRQIPPLRFDN